MKELYKKIDEFHRKVNLRNKREMSGIFYLFNGVTFDLLHSEIHE